MGKLRLQNIHVCLPQLGYNPQTIYIINKRELRKERKENKYIYLDGDFLNLYYPTEKSLTYRHCLSLMVVSEEAPLVHQHGILLRVQCTSC